MTCPFCNLGANNRHAIVLENEFCLFLQEPQEVLIGSGLIIPKAHRETVFELTIEEWEATFSLLKLAKDRMEAEDTPDGYNIGWNAGRVAGQEIFHAHLHVVPRYADEPLSGKGFRHWLKQPSNKRSK